MREINKQGDPPSLPPSLPPSFPSFSSLSPSLPLSFFTYYLNSNGVINLPSSLLFNVLPQ